MVNEWGGRDDKKTSLAGQELKINDFYAGTLWDNQPIWVYKINLNENATETWLK